jgi:flagellar operon protein (TIGR03826 family)
MGELSNCPKCNQLFLLTHFQNVCRDCSIEEEALFNLVYNYIRKRENRTATMLEVTEATGVNEDLIAKWIRSGKLKTTAFPNLGYKCEKCGITYIQSGKLCAICKVGMKRELTKIEEMEEKQRKSQKGTYFKNKY